MNHLEELGLVKRLEPIVEQGRERSGPLLVLVPPTQPTASEEQDRRNKQERY